MVRDVTEGKISAGEVGYWLSHLIIYLEIIKRAQGSEMDLPSLILEDDFDVESDLK